eukprot:5976979-Prymnesium_polylepis.1
MDGLDEAVTLIPKGPALSLAVALCSVPRLSAPALSLHRARCARFHEGMSVRAHRRFVRHDLPQGHDFYMEMTLSSAAKLMHWQVHALRCAARKSAARRPCGTSPSAADAYSIGCRFDSGSQLGSAKLGSSQPMLRGSPLGSSPLTARFLAAPCWCGCCSTVRRPAARCSSARRRPTAPSDRSTPRNSPLPYRSPIDCSPHARHSLATHALSHSLTSLR